jgi:tetratricopeptide (TPR) repeat protein
MSDWLEAEQRVERAQQLFESQRWAEALAELEVALSINPHNASWQAQCGFLLDELDRPDEAVGAYQRALELEPGDSEVAIALGTALTRLERHAEALVVFEELSRRYPALEAGYCHRVGIYAELGRHDQAEQMFYLAQQLDETCPHCFFHMGKSLAARGRTERAIYCWQRVLELEPGYAGVKRRIGQAYRAQGKLDRAREFYLAELRDDPGDTELLYELADLALAQGQVASAAAKFALILEVDPEYIEAQFALGKIWLRKSCPGEALKCFEAIVLARGGEVDLPGFDAKLGEALFRLGRYPEACQSVQVGIEKDPRNLQLLALMGDILLAWERPLKAADCFRRVLALDPSNPCAHNNLGVCLLQAGRYNAGLEHYLEAIRLKPDYLSAMHNAVLAHLRLAQWRPARSLLARARRLSPDNTALQRLSRRIWRFRLRHCVRRLLRPASRPSSRTHE